MKKWIIEKFKNLFTSQKFWIIVLIICLIGVIGIQSCRINRLKRSEGIHRIENLYK